MTIQIRTLLLMSIAAFAACSSDTSHARHDEVAPRRAQQAGMASEWMAQPATVQYAEVRRGPKESSEPRQAAAKSTPLPEASSSGSSVCSEPTGGPAPMTIIMPRETAIGEAFTYEINVTAAQCVGNVMVSDLIPNGATFVRSEPPADQQGDRLRWNLGDLDKGQTATIKTTLRADKEGTLASCAMISSEPRTCSQIFVGRALLASTLTGPETAVVGTTMTYLYTVSNKGTMVAKSVNAVVELPEGLISVNDQRRIGIEIGDLAPNESKTISGAIKTLKKGKYQSIANTASSNAGESRADATTTVLQPGLKLAMQGTPEQFLTRIAAYKMVVSNIGDIPLTAVTLTDSPAAESSIVAAPGASVTGNQIVWTIGALQPGEEKSFDVSLTSIVAGKHCNNATVTTTEQPPETAQACTAWSGLGALRLEFLDDPDPIRIDEETTYTVKVTNQGTADLNNITTIAEFDVEATPVTTSAGTVEGQKVTFPKVPKLGPKEAFTFTVRVKGVKAGDARNKVTIASDDFSHPIVAEEGLRVF